MGSLGDLQDGWWFIFLFFFFFFFNPQSQVTVAAFRECSTKIGAQPVSSTANSTNRNVT